MVNPKAGVNENVISPNERTVLTFPNCFVNIITAGNSLYYIIEAIADKAASRRRPLG